MFERRIVQKVQEPPRRYFTDDSYFDLYVWYKSSDFKEIIGFQLIYREFPLNTDEEYFISHWPRGHSPVETGKTAAESLMHPAPKLIRKTENPPPDSFFERFKRVSVDLPKEVLFFLESEINSLGF